jgi:hypothetical protein
MARSKKTGGKIVPRRAGTQQAQGPTRSKEPVVSPEDAAGTDIIKARAAVREKNQGFLVIKIVVGVLMLLILGTAVATKLSGRPSTGRGEKIQGEKCKSNVECAPGHICYSYEGDHSRCMAICSPQRPCQADYTCKSNLDQKARKGVVLHNVCVANSQL